MFNFFISFKRARTTKEALILYISHLIVGLLVVMAIVLLMHKIIPLNFYMQSYFGNFGAVLYITWLSLRIMQNREWNFKNTALTVISALISIFGGLVFGLIPLAFLTTLKPERITAA